MSTPLREKMLRDMKIRGMSNKTQQAYIAAVEGLAKHYHRSPDKIHSEEIQNYLLYLLDEKKLAFSSCNVAINAFRFFLTKP